MEYKLGRYKFGQCRHSRGVDPTHKFICSNSHVKWVQLQSRRYCDTCEHFEPKDPLTYMLGLPQEREHQKTYEDKRKRRR